MSTKFPKGCTIRRLKRRDEPGNGWVTTTRAELKPADSIAITYTNAQGNRCTSYDCYRPPRPRDMDPVQYFRRFKCVPDDYTRRHAGRYYCNPAHCKRSWANKAERDAHLGVAHAILG